MAMLTVQGEWPLNAPASPERTTNVAANTTATASFGVRSAAWRVVLAARDMKVLTCAGPTRAVAVTTLVEALKTGIDAASLHAPAPCAGVDRLVVGARAHAVPFAAV